MGSDQRKKGAVASRLDRFGSFLNDEWIMRWDTALDGQGRARTPDAHAATDGHMHGC